MGIIAYFVLKVGFLSVDLDSANEIGASVVIWLIAFIAGFSDRFADSILHTLVGRFGGNPDDELVNLQGVSTSFGISQSFESLTESLPLVGGFARRQREKREQETTTDEKESTNTQKDDTIKSEKAISSSDSSGNTSKENGQTPVQKPKGRKKE